MSDYSSVAPPQSQLNQSQAFAAALQRAKQIAAKIQPGSQQQQQSQSQPQQLLQQQQQQQHSLKRTLNDDDCGPESKKFGSNSSDSNSSQQNTPAPNMTQAMAQAAAVAARLAATAGNTCEETVRYPDCIVNLMHGRNSSDNLSHIQAETGCKIQLSNDSDFVCTLRGSRDSVTKAKDMIKQMIQQNGVGTLDMVTSITIPPPGANGYPPYQEIMIPGPKVGLVIGKGGETIKQLQEKTGAKMVIIQDGPNQEAIEKPLRVSGEPQKIEHAKSLVLELIADKEPPRQTGFNGSSGGEQAEVFVPKVAVGVVIGKGGDMIKKIQGETGCKLQFIQGKNDGPGDRRCIIQGTRQQVDDAKRMIEDLIESVMRSNQQSGNRNGGGNQQQDNGNSAYGYGYGVNHTPQPQREEVTFSVPSAKCGIVIGRGGETIKLINQQTGAYCEMDRSAVNPPSEKLFKCKGTSEQIEHARQMISEKINVDIQILSRKQIAGNAAPNQGNNMQNDNSGGYPQQQQQQQQQWGYPGWDQSQQQAAAPMNPGGAAGGADYSQQWIEYYKLMGMHREAEMIEQQVKAKQGGAIGGGPPQQPQVPQQPMQPSGQAPVQDYSAQWAEYYRSIGKMDEAEAIEKSIATQKTTGAAPNPNSGPAQQGGMPGMPAGQQYAQYSQYYAAAAAAGYPGYGYPGYGGQPQPGGQQNQQNPNDKN